MNERINLQAFYQGLDALFRGQRKTEIGAYLEGWLAKARAADDALGVIAVQNERGGWYRASGNLALAAACYDEALHLLEQLGLLGSEDHATTLINAGDVYVYQKKFSEALSVFLKAREILQGRGMDGDYRMAALSNNISMAYRELGRYGAAEAALEVAFRIIKGLPECRGELATTYINLGDLQLRQEKWALAEDSYQAACRIFAADGGTDVHYAAACAGLGQIAAHKGERAAAAEQYRKALVLTERDFGKNRTYEMLEKKLRDMEAGE